MLQSCAITVFDAASRSSLPRSWWCGLAVSAFNKDMDATYGLLVFASILSFISFAAVLLLTSGMMQAWFEWEHAFKVVGGVIGASSFFAFVAVVAFAGANIKGAFCSAFDPLPGNANDNNTYCGYSTSFFVAITSVVFTGLQTIAFWFWLCVRCAARRAAQRRPSAARACVHRLCPPLRPLPAGPGRCRPRVRQPAPTPPLPLLRPPRSLPSLSRCPQSRRLPTRRSEPPPCVLTAPTF